MLLDQAGSERHAKVAAHKTNNELLLAAIGTPRAGGTHGRQQAQHGRRRMWTAVNPPVGSRELRDNGELPAGVGELRSWGQLRAAAGWGTRVGA